MEIKMDTLFKEATYIISQPGTNETLNELPQILLMGRSNVGKSSFLNAMTNRKNLARVSKTPGKTLYLNFFLINQQFYLIDTPGYGYAQRSQTKQDEFIHMLETYLTQPNHLKLVCLLVDFKVGPTALDIDTYAFLKSLNVEVLVIATKKDKIPKTKQFNHEKKMKQKLNHPPLWLSVSNVTKENIFETQKLILAKIEGGSQNG